MWANELLPKASKSCPKFNKSPDLVTLLASHLADPVCIKRQAIWLHQNLQLQNENQ